MFTLSRTAVVPAIILGLSIMASQTVLAGSNTGTMSAEEFANHEQQQLGQQEGQIVQPKPVDNAQLASAAATQSAEEFASFEGTLNVVTIVTPTPAGSDD